MKTWIFICVIYSTLTVIFASDTVAEVLEPDTVAEALEPGTVAEALEPSVAPTDMENSSNSVLLGKHESLLTCLHFVLEPDEYELFPNGTIYVEAYNLTLNESHYILRDNIVNFCVPFSDEDIQDKDYVLHTSYLTLIGLGISMISLLVHLIVFTIVPDLKNLPGCNLAALCASLFCSYFLLFMIGTGTIVKYPDFCLATAVMAHFFLLASILWMSIMSYDVFMSLLRATGSLRSSSTQFTFKRFGIYSLCSFGIALLFAVSSLLADILEVVPYQFKPDYKELCWFTKKTPLSIFFAGPVIALTCLNLIFFSLSAYTLHFNKMKKGQDEQKSQLKRRYLMYFRLSVLMGITWIVGILAVVANADWLWYIFVLLNTLQGFFIFIAFTCSTKVRKYFREKYFGGRRGSEQTLSPTFQSYCFYANSIEKDMDKIVENSNEKTDTIIIHM